ncbi:hypothetical protein [Actinoplanes sp. NPDC051494]|uniref:hypothetical protein n=1 Tax=Actinoplanes sp. NPDC051494 TaxID=3363907 RepID=UPI003787C24E
MIVASLLLILVAVTLLILGLTGGSSTLLISSIVASLLAAVALVIGARQTATRRSAYGDPLPADADPLFPPEAAYAATAGPGTPTTPGTTSSRAAAGPGSRTPTGPGSRTSSTSGFTAARDADDLSGSETSAFDPPVSDPSALDEDPYDRTEPDRAAAYAAGQRDAEEGLTGPPRAADEPDDLHQDPAPTQHPSPGEALHEDHSPAAHHDTGADRTPYSGTDATRTGRRGPGSPEEDPEGYISPDYDQAASVIDAARTQEDDSWRRTPGAGEPWERDQPSSSTTDDSSTEPTVTRLAESDVAAPSGIDDGPEASAGPDALGQQSAGRSYAAEEASSGPAAEPVARDADFAAPDPEDPDDEPLPQAVRPSDAVRIARMDAEVMVVDGRPRYHMADCPHLTGRSTEALPVAEAVELGFSPCGLCRPVDRLVAAAARR